MENRPRLIPIAAAAILLASAIGFVYWYTAAESAEGLVRQAQSALARNDISGAMTSAERAVRLSPGLASAWSVLANAASRNGQWDRACEALEEYSRHQPDDASRLGYRLGRDWMLQNKTGPASRALRLSERLESYALESLQLQEQIAAVTGHSRETARCILELIKRKTFTRSDLHLVTSPAPGLYDEERLEAILQADPANRTPLLAKATLALNLNHHDDAERLLLEITAAHPEDVEAQGVLAELYAVHLPEKFYDWHRRLPAQLEDDARIWSARGKWLSHVKETAAAVRCLHESLLREPEQLSTTALLGQLLKAVGETDLGDAFTERSRHLQQIADLRVRLNEPRAREYFLPMIEELEATGRLWEAWGWCVIYDQTEARKNSAITACKNRLEPQLHADLPRTRPGSLPGESFAWERFPLPDWSLLKSFAGATESIADEPRSGIRFEDRAEEVGLDFRFVNSYSPQVGRRIFEAMGAGVAVLDYDRDGWPDLYFPQGNASPTDTSQGPSDRLYRNDHGERFVDVTSLAGIHETSYSQGVAAGDYDNDGFPDVYVANLGRNRLYRNNGDGTFTDATDEAGLRQNHWTESCAIADLNGDGLPELFDVNYVQGKDLLTRVCTDAEDRPTVCRPTMYDPVLDTVSINLGDGRFLEQQAECGLDLPQGMGLGLVVGDFNDDDRLDVFVANDMTANYLLINEQLGPDQPLQFRDEASLRGMALDQYGLAQACMGVACADLNRDRLPDLFVTNFSRESNTLYLSQASGFYQDRTQEAALRDPSFDPLGFGTQFLDADSDGWHDLAVVNGHIDKFAGEPYRMKPQFFQGRPDGRFTELFAADVGAFLDRPRLGRGMALVDWNRDGRMDFVATDLEDAVLLAENRTETGNRSLWIQLIGTQSNRDAIGAKVQVTVSAGDERFAQVTAGDGYESSNQRFISIGVGAADVVDRVEIKWPSGQVSQADQVRVDREWMVIEGQSEWRPGLNWPSRRAPQVVADAVTEVQVREFCGACHVVPHPSLLPRASWREEIPKAYGRFHSSGLKNLKAPDQAEVIDYFSRLAPEHLVIPAAPAGAESPVAFVPQVIDLPQSYQSSAVSYFNLEHLRSAPGGSASNLLLCDMGSGWLHRFAWKDGQWSNAPLCKLHHPDHVVPCDFDRDGREDFLVADLGTFWPSDEMRGSVVLLRSTGDSARFDVFTVQEGLGRVADAQLADLDGDGDHDFVVAEFGFEKVGRLLWLETESIADGRPNTKLHVIDARHGSIHAPVTDLDGDGDLDIVALISQEHETIVAFLNNGQGDFEKHTLFQADNPAFGSSGMELVDLDKDGDIDVLFTNGDTLDTLQLRPSHGVHWLENRGSLKFEHHLLAALPGAVRAIAADLDHDGDTDIAAVALCPGVLRHQARPDVLDTIIWLEQTGPALFERHVLGRFEVGHMAIAAGDFDGDDDLDLAVGEFSAFAPGSRRWFTIFWNQLKTLKP